MIPLPPKKSFGNNNLQHIEKRKAGLDAYVQSFLATYMGNNSFWNHPVVMNFFDIPITQPLKKPIAAANSQSSGIAAEKTIPTKF